MSRRHLDWAFVALSLVLRAGSLQAGDESTLPNGLVLPRAWPPPATPLSREPAPVPYLRSLPAVIPIDRGRQLFVDDFLVAQTNLTRTFHQPVPYAGNPILEPDRAWENGPVGPMAFPFSDGVWFDPQDQLFKMWYLASARAPAPRQGPESGMATCYAVSRDGLHWTKPALDVVPGTNIVLEASRDSAVVWLDRREPDQSRRFKLVRTHRLPDRAWGMSLHTSPDGIHWTGPVATTPSYPWFGDRSTVYFDPFREVWIYSVRQRDFHPQLGRIRCYCESPDLAAGLTRLEPVPWTGADRLDPRHPRFPNLEPQLYNLDGFAYESLMVGLFSIWQGPENADAARLHVQKRNEILVGFSRDGFHWERPDRHPFIAVNDEEAAWNGGNVQSVGGGCVIVGDELFFYYSGRRRNDEHWDASCRTGVARLRRDGFSSMDAAGSDGVLTTRPVRFKGRHLFVNADTRGGELRVEVLDADGQLIPQLAAANCVAVRSDGTKIRVGWTGIADLAPWRNQSVSLRFRLSHGRLFSFWVSDDPAGSSQGEIAAGGPGLNGLRDEILPNP